MHPTNSRDSAPQSLTFPEGRRFAFTVLDDTDDATLENVRPVYDLLARLGMRTTKTVWPLDSPNELKGHFHRGETLQNDAYRAWILELNEARFEIAFHNASMISCTRARTLEALQLMEELFGHKPRLHCNHGQNAENLYWGAERYSSGVRHIRRLLEAVRPSKERYVGHVEDSPYFWGDIAQTTFSYVRAFAFRRVDCSRIPPGRPFFDARKPWVRTWFNTSDAPTVREFTRLLTRRRLERLRDQGGWCIVSTHFGKGFVDDGRVHPEVEDILSWLASEPGWFVPASELLDHVQASEGPRTLSDRERSILEIQHIADRLIDRLSYR